MTHYKVGLQHRNRADRENPHGYDLQQWEMTVTDDGGNNRPSVQDVITYFTVTYPSQVVIDGTVTIEPYDPESTGRGTIKFIEAECVVTFRYKRVINGHDVWEDGIMAINTNPFDQIKLSEAFQAQFPGLDIKDISLFFGTTQEYLAYLGVDENGDDKEDDIAKSFKRRSHRFAQIAIDKGDINAPRYTEPVSRQAKIKIESEIVPCSQCRFFVAEDKYNPDGSCHQMVGKCLVPLPPPTRIDRWVTGVKSTQGCVLGEREQ